MRAGVVALILSACATDPVVVPPQPVMVIRRAVSAEPVAARTPERTPERILAEAVSAREAAADYVTGHSPDDIRRLTPLVAKLATVARRMRDRLLAGRPRPGDASSVEHATAAVREFLAGHPRDRR